jgi:hypothetical protein
MDLRRHQRFSVHFQSVLSSQQRVGWFGTVMNLSKGGCLVEADSQVYSGMYVTMSLEVPGETSPILVERAAVRWNRGREIGVGFITVAPPNQERLDKLLERLKQDCQG